MSTKASIFVPTVFQGIYAADPNESSQKLKINEVNYLYNTE